MTRLSLSDHIKGKNKEKKSVHNYQWWCIGVDMLRPVGHHHH